MIKNTLRAFASLLVLSVSGIALAAPAKTVASGKAEAPVKTSMSAPLKAQPKVAAPVVAKSKADAPVKASTPAPSASKGTGDSAEKKGAASHKKGSTKKDAAKSDKNDNNSAKH